MIKVGALWVEGGEVIEVDYFVMQQKRKWSFWNIFWVLLVLNFVIEYLRYGKVLIIKKWQRLGGNFAGDVVDVN